MTFGDAIEAMKQGKRVAREGWTDMSLWVALEGSPDEGENPNFHMTPQTGEIIVGRLAAQKDVIAQDWSIIGEDGL